MNAASKKILIADDDASIRLVLSQAFTRLGYQVRATGNAATMLKWVKPASAAMSTISAPLTSGTLNGSSDSARSGIWFPPG